MTTAAKGEKRQSWWQRMAIVGSGGGKGVEVNWQTVVAFAALLLTFAMGVYQFGKDTPTQTDLDSMRDEINVRNESERSVLESRIEQNALQSTRTQAALERVENKVQGIETGVAVLRTEAKQQSQKLDTQGQKLDQLLERK